jgi:cytochrome c biogenesis protein CcdA
VYGAGTALPVVAFAFLAAFSAKRVGQAFNRLSQVERWARRAAGAVFVLVGVTYSLTYIFGVIPPIGRWLR